jgi:hypothetical protein
MVDDRSPGLRGLWEPARGERARLRGEVGERARARGDRGGEAAGSPIEIMNF